jgi:hypothetical protein
MKIGRNDRVVVVSEVGSSMGSLAEAELGDAEDQERQSLDSGQLPSERSKLRCRSIAVSQDSVATAEAAAVAEAARREEEYAAAALVRASGSDIPPTRAPP